MATMLSFFSDFGPFSTSMEISEPPAFKVAMAGKASQTVSYLYPAFLSYLVLLYPIADHQPHNIFYHITTGRSMGFNSTSYNMIMGEDTRIARILLYPDRNPYGIRSTQNQRSKEVRIVFLTPAERVQKPSKEQKPHPGLSS